MPRKNKDKFEFFDDCPICQAMKEGKAGTKDELIEVFKKAKEKGAIIGGKWFEEKK